jgi:TRAP-type C4-dicarboxylate transport system permease small subunit
MESSFEKSSPSDNSEYRQEGRKEMKRAFKRAIDWMDFVIIRLSILVMSVLILINFFDYVRRYFWGKSLTWAMDLTLFAGAWVFCLGFSIVIKRKEDIRVEFLYNLFPPLAKKAVAIAISLTMIFMSVLISINTIELARSQSHLFIYTMKPLTEKYRTLALPAGFMLSIVFLVYHLWDEIESLAHFLKKKTES